MPSGSWRDRRVCFQAAARGSRQPKAAGADAAAPLPSEAWDGVDTRKEVDRILISKYSPAGVVVDDDLEVVEIRGKANPYLTLPAGKVSFNLIKLIPDTGLFLQVEKLIQQARKSGEPARQDRVSFGADGSAGGLERGGGATGFRSNSMPGPLRTHAGGRRATGRAAGRCLPKAIPETARSHA